MKSVTTLRPPVSYYGGKQLMVRDILPLIPAHKLYLEPYFGGGAVFWRKPPSESECINDVNGNIVNFYEVLKHEYFKLRERVESTLHSRDTYKKALVIYECPWLFPEYPVIRAWAFYVCCNQGFASKVGTWGYDRGRFSRTVQKKIDDFTEDLSERLRYVTIENNRADIVIASRDTPDTFVYADPPYIGTDQGHYGGYTEEHFERDLKVLSQIKGKFLLSNFPSPTLDRYVEEHGWHVKKLRKLGNAGNQSKMKAKNVKTELLVANYRIE